MTCPDTLRFCWVLRCAYWLRPIARRRKSFRNTRPVRFERRRKYLTPCLYRQQGVAFLPESVDISERFPIPGNQGRYGSCVAWAIGYAARSYYDAQPNRGRNLSKNKIASPAYIYNSLTNGHCSPTTGVSPYGVLALLRDHGAMSLADFAYSDKRCPVPSQSMKAAVSEFRISGFLLVGELWSSNRTEPEQLLNSVKQELAFGHPVMISVGVTSTFGKGRGRSVWRGDGRDEKNGRGEKIGHEITLTGYDDRKKQLKFINSWSANWGYGGFGFMTYEAFKKKLWEAYVIRMPFEPEPPKPLPTPTPEDFKFKLPDMNCGGVIIERDGRNFKLTGYAGKQEDVDAIKRAVAGRSDVTVEVELRPWPQCETLTTLRNVLADKRKPEVSFPKSEYNTGETLDFEVSMAAYQGYLHVAYIQADGNVVNLVQSSSTSLKTLAPKQRMKFGDGREGRPKFTVSDPVGNEMVVVIASKSPLFDRKRPKVEVERDFLSALREAIISRPDTSSPERLVTADYFVLTTRKGDQ